MDTTKITAFIKEILEAATEQVQGENSVVFSISIWVEVSPKRNEPPEDEQANDVRFEHG